MHKRRLKLFNSESLKKEEILPFDKKTVRIYTCGPTVYDFAHIGNFRTYIFEDLLRRSLQFLGERVTQVMNLTDVDDKTIRGAILKKVSLDEFTEPFKRAFFEDLKLLNIEPAEHYPSATNYVEKMVEMIQSLLSNGYAYVGVDGSIYFSIKRFATYGRLSHLEQDKLKEGASKRVDADEYDKESPSDFVLWKSYDPKRDGTIYWESPFGKGRPGWHLECSCMALDLLGSEIDIHCGGEDNLFPHHENEIAQSEAYTGKQFVRHWVHSKHLLVDQRKMSKSLGNFYTLRSLLAQGFSADQIRFLLLQTHYRTPLNFTFEGLNAAKSALDRIFSFFSRLQELETSVADVGLVDPLIKEAAELFEEALADDLNISAALAVLFELIREVNALCDQKKVSRHEADQIVLLLKKWDKVLGLLSFTEASPLTDQHLRDLLNQREEARGKRDFALADQIRQEIASLGFVIEDSPKGPRLVKKGASIT